MNSNSLQLDETNKNPARQPVLQTILFSSSYAPRKTRDACVHETRRRCQATSLRKSRRKRDAMLRAAAWLSDLECIEAGGMGLEEERGGDSGARDRATPSSSKPKRRVCISQQRGNPAPSSAPIRH